MEGQGGESSALEAGPEATCLVLDPGIVPLPPTASHLSHKFIIKQQMLEILLKD